MKPDTEKLKNDPGYRQILELDFQDMIPFVLSNIRSKGIFSRVYMVINAGMLGFILYAILEGFSASSLTWGQVIKQALAGILIGSILIIPVHEGVHGLVYRLLGARKIKFGADLQQFIFYVTADRYPVSGAQIYILALSPFVVINGMTLIATFFWFPHLWLLTLFFLLSHNVMCIGDFAISNYVYGKRPNRVYSYDETEIMKSYFFEKIDIRAD